jgi:catechol 2,3-dioxygenase-like lactoylglutathione lyase family enzyme
VVLECRSLPATERFYRDFLGLDVEPRGAGYFFSRGNGGVRVIVVERGEEVLDQTVMNHHGVTLWCDTAQIDAIHRAANEASAAFGIKKLMPVARQHGSYSFYLQDLDTNWWEIEVWENHVDPWTRAGGTWIEGRPQR